MCFVGLWRTLATIPPPTKKTTANCCTRGGRLDVLQWLEVDLGLPFDGDGDACSQAAKAGHLDALHATQRSGSSGACAIGNSLAPKPPKTVIWMHSSSFRLEVQPPFSWDEKTSTAAAGSYRCSQKEALRMLRWMREEASPPCPWDKETSHAALKAERWKMLRWICWEAHCPASKRTLRELRKHEKETAGKTP